MRERLFFRRAETDEVVVDAVSANYQPIYGEAVDRW